MAVIEIRTLHERRWSGAECGTFLGGGWIDSWHIVLQLRRYLDAVGDPRVLGALNAGSGYVVDPRIIWSAETHIPEPIGF